MRSASNPPRIYLATGVNTSHGFGIGLVLYRSLGLLTHSPEGWVTAALLYRVIEKRSFNQWPLAPANISLGTVNPQKGVITCGRLPRQAQRLLP
jgi:hypothetical protein